MQDRLLTALEQDLERDLSDYQQLLSVSQGLHDALLRRDSQAVDAANQQVTALLEQLGARAQRRSRILQAFSLDLDKHGMQRLIAQCEPVRGQRLGASWAALEQRVMACNQQNERNGKLLAMQQDILNQLLSQSSAADIYSPQYY
jgi:flagella synthesis protein FlgN